MRNGAQRLPEVAVPANDPRSKALVSVLSRRCFNALNSNVRFPERVTDIQNRAVCLFLDIVALEEDTMAGSFTDWKRFFQGFKIAEYALLLASVTCYSIAAYKLARNSLKTVLTVSTLLGLSFVYVLLYLFAKPYVEHLIARRHDRRLNAVMWFIGNGFLSSSLAGGAAALSAYLCLRYNYTADRVVGFEMLLYGSLFLLVGFKLRVGFVALDVFAAWILGVLFQGKQLLLHPAPSPSADSRDAGYQILKSFAGSVADIVPLSHTFGYGIGWVCLVFFFRPMFKLFEVFVAFGHTHMSVGAFLDRYLGVIKVPEYALRSDLNARLGEFSRPFNDAEIAYNGAREAMKGIPALSCRSDEHITNAYNKAKSMVNDSFAALNSAREACSQACKECDLNSCKAASQAAVSAHSSLVGFISIAEILARRNNRSKGASTSRRGR